MAKYAFLVEVKPQYLADQSAPHEDLYVFAYTITITNIGEVTAQLISRTWNVNDATGHTERVKGLGVVGQQPLLKPGQAYQGEAVAQTTRAFSDLYGTYGYAFARVDSRPEIDRATGQVAVVLAAPAPDTPDVPKVSPFTKPLTVALSAGLVSPYVLLALLAVTVRCALLIVRAPSTNVRL